jgi:hypothetical protein
MTKIVDKIVEDEEPIAKNTEKIATTYQAVQLIIKNIEKAFIYWKITDRIDKESCEDY